ncbi:hypothetical protein L484_014246 [Morus notabilis]|uniref:Uncharacterized protein n=1 Tax=Morus notabilis TaxID=981085 RepID=W9S0C8_9ROSA|nr:hypothetical protein L484_014246 [Morus notabilis]
MTQNCLLRRTETAAQHHQRRNPLLEERSHTCRHVFVFPHRYVAFHHLNPSQKISQVISCPQSDDPQQPFGIVTLRVAATESNERTGALFGVGVTDEAVLHINKGP